MSSIYFDEHIIKYLKNWIHDNFYNKSFDEIFIKIFHSMLIIFLIFGIFLPANLFKLYLLFYVGLVLSWFLFGGCLLTKIYDNNDFIPISPIGNIAIQLVWISSLLLIYYFPSFSPFNIIYNIFTYLKQYD